MILISTHFNHGRKDVAPMV